MSIHIYNSFGFSLHSLPRYINALTQINENIEKDSKKKCDSIGTLLKVLLTAKVCQKFKRNKKGLEGKDNYVLFSSNNRKVKCSLFLICVGEFWIYYWWSVQSFRERILMICLHVEICNLNWLGHGWGVVIISEPTETKSWIMFKFLFFRHF